MCVARSKTQLATSRNGMQQLTLTTAEKPGLSALGADAKSSGDLKEIAALVYPVVSKKDPEKARNDLSDALRANHARKLDIDEAIEIIVNAVSKTGRSSLIEHILARFPKDTYEFRWVPKQEQVERRERRIETLLDAVQIELAEWKKARVAK